MSGDPFEPRGEAPVVLGKQGERIESVADWQTRAPPAVKDQWRPGRSACESARAWFRAGSPRVPAELTEVFDSRRETRALRVATALPERKTHFSDGTFGRATTTCSSSVS